jgi:hypothetical protein
MQKRDAVERIRVDLAWRIEELEKVAKELSDITAKLRTIDLALFKETKLELKQEE